MESLLEHNLHLSQSEIMDQGLKVQNEAYGVLDVPFLNNFLKNHSTIKKVLDIGTGEGSFILSIAKQNPKVMFLGIDLNKDLIGRANVQKEANDLNNVDFKTSFFDNTFENNKFDLIFTRFTLEHSTDHNKFIKEVFNRLNDGGYFVVIEEYWLDTGIKDKTWQTFRKFMLDSYKSFGGNPYVPRDLTGWLRKAGFSDITSSLPVYSPMTIGADKFRSLILTIPALIHKMRPNIWDEQFFSILEKWIDDIIETKRLDPFITIAHVTAKK